MTVLHTRIALLYTLENLQGYVLAGLLQLDSHIYHLELAVVVDVIDVISLRACIVFDVDHKIDRHSEDGRRSHLQFSQLGGLILYTPLFYSHPNIPRLVT